MIPGASISRMMRSLNTYTPSSTSIGSLPLDSARDIHLLEALGSLGSAEQVPLTMLSSIAGADSNSGADR